MKIKTKFLLIFFGIGCTLIFGVVGSFYFFVLGDLKQEIYKQLEAVIISEASHIDALIEEQEEKIVIISSDSEVVELLKMETDSSSYDAVFESVDKSLEQMLQTEFDEISIFNREGDLILTTGRSYKSGHSYADSEIFLKSKEGTYIKENSNEDMSGKITLDIGAPIVDNVSDDFLGVIFTKIEMVHFNEVTAQSSELGYTEESYLVNSDGYMITPSRFVEDAVFNQKIETMGSRHCFENHSEKEHGAAKVYEDYRGSSVLGVHAYILEPNWCLLAEIDEKEAFDSLNKSMLVLVALSFITLCIIFISYKWLGFIISGPLDTLQKGIKIIESGNLDYRINVRSSDEIGNLTKSFNQMAEKIGYTRSEIARKVKEQTESIEEKSDELTNQQTAILNILEDIEAEKDKASGERDKNNKILHSIGDGVFVIDENEKVILFNKAAEKISGHFAGEIIGEKYSKKLKFVLEMNKKVNRDFIDKPTASGKIYKDSGRTQIIKSDGSYVPVSIVSSPVESEDGRASGCVVVFNDVTKEREIDKAKSEFVSLASHQLRTPLTAINWYLEMILTGDTGKINKMQKDYLNEVYQGSNRMVQLVNSLLNVSRIDLGTFAIDPEPVNFKEVSDSVINELKVRIIEKNISMHKKYEKDLPIVSADPKLTRIIFQNLISNAVKYTPEKGKVSVIIRKEKENVLIEVEDTGYGIPKDQQSKIFTKLFRADNVREREVDGTGLGLYIVRSIVEKSGGKVWFESRENKGTTFYVKIPLMGMKKNKGTKDLAI